MTNLRGVDGVEGTGATRRRPFGNNPRVGERGSETERRIFNAALEVFADVGFTEARVELITQRAGCSRPAFYQYFSSKDDVFWKLANELGGKMIALGRRLDPIGPDTEGITHLADWIASFTDLYQDYSPIFSAFQTASRQDGSAARRSSAFSARLDTDLLRAFGRRNRGRDQALASGMAAVLIRCSFYWEAMAATGSLDRQRLVDGLARVLHRLFHGPIVGVNVSREAPLSPSPHTVKIARVPATGDPRPLRPRGEQTRRSILDAGAQVLPKRGYHDARVDDIVTAAGISHGSFYRYFDDKDDFFRTLTQEAAAQMIELLERFPTDGDARALRSWVGGWFDSYRNNGGVITTWQELQEANGDLVAYSQQVAATIVAGLVELLEAQGADDALLDALVLLALLERLPYRTYTLGFTTRRAAIDATVTIVRRGLMGFAD